MNNIWLTPQGLELFHLKKFLFVLLQRDFSKWD